MGASTAYYGDVFIFFINQDIRQQCGIQPMGEWILKRLEKWDIHV
jgi:hypothetical protein